MYPAVKEVIPGDNYILSVVFDNGEKGYLDMKPILHFGIFQRIKDYEAFKRVRVAFDTIEWDCVSTSILSLSTIKAKRITPHNRLAEGS
jgi:hypothetical protein